MKKILEVGPSPTRSKGGMATVISGILNDKNFNNIYSIDCHESYIDGNLLTRMLVSAMSYLKFMATYKKYDIFHVHAASYGSTFRKGYYVRFLKKHGKKVVLHVHGAEYLVFYNKLSLQKKEIVKDIWKKADRIIALSDDWKKQFEEIFAVNNIVAVNNGIDVEQFTKAVCDINKNKQSFLLLGRIGKRKGAYDIIEAAEKLCKDFPDMKIYMAGDGETEKAKAIIKEKNLENNILVVGWIDFDEKVRLMSEVSTILLPSYNEGLPMTILEGMAAGKVIISTNVGAIPEVVKNRENGIIINPGDIDALAEAMREVMVNNDFDILCSKNNVEKIDNEFSRKIMHRKIADIFKEIE